MDIVHFEPASIFLDLANKVSGDQKARITELLPLADIQHIGSTSISGSVTKGDLDITVRVPEKEFRNAAEGLKSLYEINQPENWSDIFASFKDEKSLGIDFGVHY